MDWNSKGGCWDLTELDEAALQNIERIENKNKISSDNNGGSRFGLVKRRSEGGFCVDLKLGHHDDDDEGVNNCGITKEESSSKWKRDDDASGGSSTGGGVSKTTASGSWKRGRGMSNGGRQTASCLVDGCNSDLSNCREYHRRHKVCELHSKTPVVTIAGHNQRFCQQCSRFHSLEEFDEGKRSCRKRLDGHNRRRRKPQPLLPLTPSSAPIPTFFSNYQGTQVLASSSNAYGGGAGGGWDGRLQQVHKQELFVGSRSSCNYRNTNNKQHQEMEYAQAPPPCALSLLSSPMAMTLNVHPLGLTLQDTTASVPDLQVNNNNINGNGTTSIYMPNSHASSPPFHWD